MEGGGILINRTTGLIDRVFTDRPATEQYLRQQAAPAQVTVRELAADDILMPGLICAHGHFYGMYARGMNFLRSGEESPRDFTEVLDKLWWRLDRALDLEATRLSTLVCLAAALKSGTTTIIDHHSSPGHATGSLAVIAEAARQAGVRCALAFEVTDRNGPAEASLGMDENERAIESAVLASTSGSAADGMISASFGLHASFTVGDDTLRQSVSRLRRLSQRHGLSERLGFHIHLAESQKDQTDSMARWGLRTTQRLADAGLLTPATLLGHGVFLEPQEVKLIAQAGCGLVTNVTSNANNGVGLPRVESLLDEGVLLGIGTDGMSYDMFNEYHGAYLLHKLHHRDPRAMPGHRLATMLLDHNATIASRLFQPFGAPQLGAIKEQAAADVIVLRYPSPTPLTVGNFPWHMVFGFGAKNVTTSIIRGRVVLEDGHLLTLDEALIARQAHRHAASVWDAVSKV